MAGGGKSGVLPHSKQADILDVSDLSTAKVVTNKTALAAARWGLACTTIGNKYVTEQSYDQVPRVSLCLVPTFQEARSPSLGM